MRYFVIVVLSFVSTLAGCGKSSKELAEEAAKKIEQDKVAADKENQERLLRTVKGRFRDPDSAKFIHLYLVRKESTNSYALCGYVNARNGFGGYVGYRLFVTSDTPLKLNGQRVMIAEDGIMGFYGTYAGVSEVGCGAWIIEHGAENPS